MKKILAVLAFSALLTPMSVCRAQQQDPVVMEINGEKVTESQFMKEFLSSQGKIAMEPTKTSAIERRKALNEYVDLYVNYRAKLADAYAMGIDTIGSLNAELKQYRDELAAPYLIDSATMQSILREAYERNAYSVHAAHILIKVGADAPAEDTLKAYNTAMQYYERAIKGEDFYALAHESKMAQRAKVLGEPERVNPIEGDLGCFTVFDMIYPFENAAYTIEPGTVGKPIRTKYGYHVIKVFERVPFYGKTQVRHIWAQDRNKPARAKARVNIAYESLKEGRSWEAMARQHSDDYNTADNGGLMPVLSLKQMPYDYVAQIVKQGLKVGDTSTPFETRFGWHIIKVEKLDTLPPYEDMLPFYKQRLSRDQRSTNPRAIYAKHAKDRYDFLDYTQEKIKNRRGRATGKMMASLDEVKRVVTDSIFKGTWDFDSTQLTDLRPLIRLANQNYNAIDLCQYLRETQKKERPVDISMYVDRKFKEFTEAKAIEYADSHLEEENKDFADLIDEYRHGLMIFMYNDMMVWSKAIKDSVGFNNFYEKEKSNHNFENPQDAPYFWNQRARVNMINVMDSALLDPAKALKIVNKGVKKHSAMTDIQNKLVKAMGKDAKRSDVEVSLDVLEKGKQSILNDNEWVLGVFVHPNTKGYSILVVDQLVDPTLKTLSEARGYYLNEYQNYVERQLMQELRKKYNVKVYKDVIDQIKY